MRNTKTAHPSSFILYPLRESGFTLIEIIVTLVLAGILLVFAGMGISTGIKGYLFARENAAAAQKAQLAMARLSREFMELTDLTSDPAPSVNPTNSINYDNQTGSHAIALDLGNGLITIDNDQLIDQVSGFTINLFKADGSAWTTSASFNQLYEINFSITMNLANSGPVSFSTTVNPRNNGTLNGPA